MTGHDAQAEAEDPTLHPGPRDEGGEGGMATRELHAHEAHQAHHDHQVHEDPDGRDDEAAPAARGD